MALSARHIIYIIYTTFILHCNAAATCEISDDGVSSCTPLCETEQWISQNGSIPGYHVLCITKDNTANALNIEFYRDGIHASSHSGRYISNAKDYKSLRIELERILKIQLTDKKRNSIPDAKDKPNRWGTFKSTGVRVLDFDFCIGTLLIFEGGIFIYPAIHTGFIRDVHIKGNDNEQDKTFKLTTLSVHPPVFLVENFIKESDCDHIVSISEAHMRISTVSHMHNTAGDAAKWRTSSTHWLRHTDDVTERIKVHCAKLLKIPKENQELIQVLRYEESQQYDSHWDYFEPSLYKGTAMEKKIRGGRNRIATLFWYMSDVFDGGWTYFPRSGNLPNPSSYKLKKISDCETGGLRVEPRKGAVILFYNMKANGEVDPLSLHGACPVGEGYVKWGANIWYWTKNAAFF